MVSWPALIILQTGSMGAVLLISSIRGDSGSPRRGRTGPLQVRKSPEVPYFKRFLRHLFVSSRLRSVLYHCRGLSGGHRQGGNPSYHRPEEPPGQIALA